MILLLSMPDPSASTHEKTAVDRFLLLFSEVRAGEGSTALLLMFNLFLLLTAYLIIKTVREALILSEGGAVVKSYAAAGQALLLLGIVPLYGFIASRVRRLKLINGVTLFFISNLLVFYALAQMHISLGVPFFLWVGIFNLLVVAQFWSFANDIYSEEQGKRLFPLIASGGSLGAILGPKIAGSLFESFGAYGLMLVTASLLGVYVVISNWVNQRISGEEESTKGVARPEQLLGRQGGFKLIAAQPYLLLIAALMVVSNLVNTTGEFLLGQKVTEEAKRVVAADRAPTAATAVIQRMERKKAQDFIARFYGDFFFSVSLVSALAQLFLVSRIMKFCGVAGSLFFLPVIALGSYSLVALAPVLTTIHFAKVVENSTDYSLQNTARQALFLPTSRDAKYKAKAAIDTFFVRMGDLLSLGVVFLSVQLSLSTQTLGSVNVLLAIIWLLLVFGIGQRYKRLALAQAQDAT
jgi:AAA family ATP:ADP antiporter